MATPEQVAQAYYKRQRQISRTAVRSAVAQWDQLEPGNLVESWLATIGRLILALITGAQRSAAEEANPYLGQMSAAQGVALSGSALVIADAFAGIASDGRALASLLDFPVILTKKWIGEGRKDSEAMAHGRSFLALLASTQVADAGRGAVSAGMTADRTWVSYVRHVVLPACSRCILLAGREYSYSTGFQRHPNCFPAGTIVSGPGARAATRRWYEGELVILRTASGQELPVTGNHPILTDRGWVPANLIQPGDQVIRSVLNEGAVPLVVPDERQMPARIEDLWRPNGVGVLVRMPTSAEDFHGDGGHGDVDVVLADGLLRNRIETANVQPVDQLLFGGTRAFADSFAPESMAAQLLVGSTATASRIMGGSGLGGSLIRSHLGCSHLASVGASSDLDAALFKAGSDDVAAHLVAEAEAVLALTGQVRRRDLLYRQGEGPPSSSSRWDPAGLYGSAEGAVTYARRGLDLGDKLAGQVELDGVIELRRVHFAGHVYNLTSDEGWYAANSLIVSNCDCTMIPRIHHTDGSVGGPDPASPNDLFEQMTAEQQVKAFGRDGAEAIRLGGDIGQVVNARRGMRTARMYGREVQFTTEGTTNRSFAGRRMIEQGARTRRQAEEFATRLTRQGPEQRQITRQRVQTPRLMPEQILNEANGDRDEAIRLLRRFGYIA